MSLIAFILALIGLLATPGPSNTLLALTGAGHGPSAAARLLPAELAGYLCAVLPLSLARLWVDLSSAGFSTAVQGAAAAWVALLALRLGLRPLQSRRPGPSPRCAADQPSAHAQITRGQIFLTTLLNPKGLLIALVLMHPPTSPAYGLELAALLCLVPSLGYCWGRLGALLQAERHPRRAGLFQRVAALWLGALALGLAHRALIG